MDPKQNAIGSLAHWLRLGKLDAGSILPAIEKLSLGDTPPESLLTLLEKLSVEPDPEWRPAADHLRDKLHGEALLLHQRAQRGQTIAPADLQVLGVLPLNVGSAWTFDSEPFAAVERAVWAARELAVLLEHQSIAPRFVADVRLRLNQRLAAAHAAIQPLFQRHPGSLPELAATWPADLPAPDWARVENPASSESARLESLQTRFLSSTDRTEREGIIDQLCSWPTPDAVTVLREVTLEPWAAERAAVLSTLRFGESLLVRWEQWALWWAKQFELWKTEQRIVRQWIEKQPAGLALIFYSQSKAADLVTVDQLVRRAAQSSPALDLNDLIQTWEKSIAFTERRALLGEPVPPVITPPLIAEPTRPVAPVSFAESQSAPAAVAPVEPPPPPKPSLWQRHIQPLFVENWYIVAGVAMVILGSSLLAYYTWDKHWLIRYTIMPALLAFFTWSLATAGRWIETKGPEFKNTAELLRGAAIGLLPINFMAIALLSGDENVPNKGAVLPAMAAIYFLGFGWSLNRWCGALEPALRRLLVGTLLLLNALVAVGPLARTVFDFEGRRLLFCLGAGFYLGFAVTAATIIYFVQRLLTREMAEEKRVPWFVAGTLAITYLQVFLWVHGFMRHVPRPYTYALLVIGAGWLVLLSERRALQWRENPHAHGGESFLGFALVLLGLLMGFGQPTVRVPAFLAAGAVWLYQAWSRKHPLHYWIALTLFGLGVASVGLLAAFPKAWQPLLGLGAGCGYGLVAWWSQRRGQLLLAQTSRGMEAAALFLTALVAPLVQWHYHSPPLMTAAWLAAVALLLAWRAIKDEKLHWLHASLVVLALMLPYAGFVDMTGRTAHHNTMVFGLAVLSWLWLCITALSPRPLILAARSTVLWFYGSLAVAAMLLRLALGDAAPDPLWYRDFMDYTGPILITLALVPATYFSRSLVPAGMAVVIIVILFPELRANLRQTMPWISWGSGFGSAQWGLLLVVLCFFLRRWRFLKQLPEGDRFLNREWFPFRRYDHTLFTWPVLAAALFLIVKVETFNLIRHAAHLPLKTAAALAITGVAWTLIGIYLRRKKEAVLGVHLGWMWLSVGIWLGYERWAGEPHWTWPCLAIGLVLQTLYLFYRFYLQPRQAWARDFLTEPMRQVLQVGSVALAIVSIAALFYGTLLERLSWLLLFLAAQLTWHALQTRQPIFGTVLFFLVWTWLLTMTAPATGRRPLWGRLTVETSIFPTLWLLFIAQLCMVAMEAPARAGKNIAQFLKPLLLPPFVVASVGAIFFGLAAIIDGAYFFNLSISQQMLLLAILLLVARAHLSGFVALLAVLLAYVLIQRGQLMTFPNGADQTRLLIMPWRLASLALAMVLLTELFRRARQRQPAALTGPFSQLGLYAPSPGWLFWPATIFAGMAALYHTFHPLLREAYLQLPTPWLGMLALAAIAGFWQRNAFYAGAALLLVLGNIHLVRVLAGDWLRGQGLSELHLICLALGLTLLEGSALKRALRNLRAIETINLASLGLAGLILALLAANYFTDPDLTAISSLRFIVSGAMAWLAGRYFRRAARSPEFGEKPHQEVCEALYHFGLVLAIWCAALLVPWFRQPFLALVALGLPLAYFYGRTEVALAMGLPEAKRYRNSASLLGFFLLGLYVFKGIFHMVLFPDLPISTDHYHYNAPVIMVTGLALLRLHGLGGTGWLGFYGGLALMIGSYFLLTWLPGLSPFHNPMPSAWCAIVLAHFWILLSYARSPLRTFIQRIARLDEAAWHGLRRTWGYWLLAGSQGAVLWGVAHYLADTYMVGPLLVGAASVWIHQGLIRQSPLYLVTAAVLVTIALHLDFLIPSYLPKDQVIWVLLLVWLALLALTELLKLPTAVAGRIALVLAALVMVHVLYQRPWTTTGLWGMALGALLAAWTPQADRKPAHTFQQFCGALWLWVPAWLVFFSQAPLRNAGLERPFKTWSWGVLTTMATIVLIGIMARLFPTRLAAAYHRWPRTQFQLIDSTLSWMEQFGFVIHQATLWLALASVSLLQLIHYQSAFATREFALLIVLEAVLAVAWGYEGKRRESILAYYLMQFAALVCFASIRRHLMLTFGKWNYEYDIWASLVFSMALAGTKQIYDLKPRAIRVPLLTTLFALPLLALVWVGVHRLGVNMALLVVGLHSVLFAYLGKDRRESPYNMVALAGFVGFVLITFYFKLQFRAVHAYVIPVGLGILILQELFRSRTSPETRNWVRLVTVMAILGSSGYYALADPRHAITFNLTMIVLCLLAMGLGSFLQIRLYLALGFAGLMVDLVSLLYKVLVQMERSSRMTVIGSLVLVVGAALVFGAIFYKTHRASFDAWLGKWRAKYLGWE